MVQLNELAHTEYRCIAPLLSLPVTTPKGQPLSLLLFAQGVLPGFDISVHGITGCAFLYLDSSTQCDVCELYRYGCTSLESVPLAREDSIGRRHNKVLSGCWPFGLFPVSMEYDDYARNWTPMISSHPGLNPERGTPV